MYMRKVLLGPLRNSTDVYLTPLSVLTCVQSHNFRINLSILSVPFEGYSRNASCELILISTCSLCFGEVNKYSSRLDHLNISIKNVKFHTFIDSSITIKLNRWTYFIYFPLVGWFMVFTATFSNISVISWQSVLLVEEIGVPAENHRKSLTNVIT